MKVFNVALIGVGNWGSILKRYFNEDKRFKLIYTCNSKSDLNEVFMDKDVDVVVVATPNDTHADLVLRALKHDKHVFCEKPLALKKDEILEIHTLAKMRRKIVFTNYLYTVSEALKEIQSMIEEKTFGNLKGIELISKQNTRDGNVYWVLGSHMLSILDMFVPLEICDFIPDVFVKIEEQPKVAQIRAYGNKVKIYMSISLNHYKKERYMIFHCDDGAIIFDAMWGEVKIMVSTSKTPKIHKFNENHNIGLALNKFYSCLLGEVVDNLDESYLITKNIGEFVNDRYS